MTRLRLRKTTESPPDSYRWSVPQTGHVIRSLDAHGWLTEARNYLRINSLPIPDDLKEQMEDQLCRTLPPGWCEYGDGSLPASYIDIRLDPDAVINATKVFAAFVLNGMALVPQEEAERRAAICAACPANVGLTGCGACVGFAEVVAGVVGATKTRADNLLVNRSCAWCKCSSKAQVHVPIEVLAKGVTRAMLDANPFEHCWKKNQIEALRA